MKAHGIVRAMSWLVVAMILGTSSVARVDAEPKCRDARLDGLYVFTASGFTSVNPGPPLPIAIVELIRFNGDGTVNVPGGRVAVNGAIFPTVGTGTYTSPTPVDTGCEATVTFAEGPSLYMFIPPNAKDIRMIMVTPNNVFQGTATQISK